MNVDHIYTGHCTGDAAYAILKEELGEKIDQFCSGYQIDM
jgi:7,8-dihydropterin-6-yl-methyl-4-(beta-D-ribofuranosyl)aminobenzene 5'-phosphate synthase